MIQIQGREFVSKLKWMLFLSIFICVFSTSASSSIIQSSVGGGSFWPGGPFPMGFGQTFVADASIENLDQIGFWFMQANAAVRPAANPTFTLYSGFGFGGPLIDTAGPIAIPEDGPSGWIFADFSSVNLTAGNTYTFSVMVNTDSEGGWGYAGGDPYADGTILDRLGNPLAGSDAAFQITGSPVPEPSTGLLLAMGLLGLASRRHR